MTRALPPLGWFRAFESAARLSSFTRAADELGLTQSAVSQQIRSLESRLDCTLFERKHRGIELTDKGRRLLPEVTTSISGLRAVVDAFDRTEHTTLLTINTSVSIAQWVLAPRLGAYMSREPGIRVRLVTSVWPDHMRRSDANVHIRFGGRRVEEADARQLGTTSLSLVASPTLIGQPRDVQLSDAELAEHSLVQSVGTRDVWSRCAPQFGYEPANHDGILVDSHGLAIDMARSGAGIAFTNEWLAQPLLADGSLIRVHPHSIQGSDGYWVSVTSTRNIDVAQRFVAWLLE